MSPSYRCANGGDGVNGRNFIQHQVSKMDTLAGVAIKYGVEVSDLKRLNGLSTDLQMFALKTLLIPSPGRHPPSAASSSSQNGSASTNVGANTSEKGIQNKLKFNFLESLETPKLETKPHRVSSVLSSLGVQNDFGTNKRTTEGTEMAVYRAEIPDFLTEGVQPKDSASSMSFFLNFKTRNDSTGFLNENGAETDYVPLVDVGDGDGEKSNEKSVRRRQKTEGDSTQISPEKLFKVENGVTSESTPPTGKKLSMRGKSASKSSLVSDTEQPWLTSFPVGLGDSIFTDSLQSVRKSSSSPSFLDQEKNNSVWATPKWSLKQDLLSTAAINIPIFDGLPKPISGRKSKTALD